MEMRQKCLIKSMMENKLLNEFEMLFQYSPHLMETGFVF